MEGAVEALSAGVLHEDLDFPRLVFGRHSGRAKSVEESLDQIKAFFFGDGHFFAEVANVSSKGHGVLLFLVGTGNWILLHNSTYIGKCQKLLSPV